MKFTFTLSTKLILLVCTLLSSACAYEKIKPWHRDILSQDLALLAPDNMETAADEHVYFSKEAAKGGQGVGGGGCGCN